MTSLHPATIRHDSSSVVIPRHDAASLSPRLPSDVDLLREAAATKFGPVKGIIFYGKDDYRKVYEVALENGTSIIATVANPAMSPCLMESEVATMQYIRNNTSIPVPKVLHTSFDPDNPLGCHTFTEQPSGNRLQELFPTLSSMQRESIVRQVALWTFELFQNHHFDKLGSLSLAQYTTLARGEEENMQTPLPIHVGPIVWPPFYVNGRARLDLDRGPWPTVRAYFSSCAQRELDCSRTLVTQGASESYMRMIEQTRMSVERSMALLESIISRCRGLDDHDEEFAPFALTFCDIGLKNMFVDPTDPTRILAIVDWQFMTTKPLWQVARLPTWIATSLLEEEQDERTRLSHVFRDTILGVAGPNNLFLRGLDRNETRLAVNDACDVDACTDNMLLPMLETLAATLPGEEDIAGLTDLLNPNTFTGRVARISLMTKGPSPETFLLADRQTSPRFSSLPQIPDLSPQPGFPLPSSSTLPSRSKEWGGGMPDVKEPSSIVLYGAGNGISATPSPTSLNSLPDIPDESERSTPVPVVDATLIPPSDIAKVQAPTAPIKAESADRAASDALLVETAPSFASLSDSTTQSEISASFVGDRDAVDLTSHTPSRTPIIPASPPENQMLRV